ncbi:unnamed protein product [Amoebophrya sp. A120]|nr:unnamed protein product [Amoebophrya sp. A120]|eukprot:GSA120T00024339001.1
MSHADKAPHYSPWIGLDGEDGRDTSVLVFQPALQPGGANVLNRVAVGNGTVLSQYQLCVLESKKTDGNKAGNKQASYPELVNLVPHTVLQKPRTGGSKGKAAGYNSQVAPLSAEADNMSLGAGTSTTPTTTLLCTPAPSLPTQQQSQRVTHQQNMQNSKTLYIVNLPTDGDKNNQVKVRQKYEHQSPIEFVCCGGDRIFIASKFHPHLMLNNSSSSTSESNGRGSTSSTAAAADDAEDLDKKDPVAPPEVLMLNKDTESDEEDHLNPDEEHKHALFDALHAEEDHGITYIAVTVLKRKQLEGSLNAAHLVLKNLNKSLTSNFQQQDGEEEINGPNGRAVNLADSTTVVDGENYVGSTFYYEEEKDMKFWAKIEGQSLSCFSCDNTGEHLISADNGSHHHIRVWDLFSAGGTASAKRRKSRKSKGMSKNDLISNFTPFPNIKHVLGNQHHDLIQALQFCTTSKERFFSAGKDKTVCAWVGNRCVQKLENVGGNLENSLLLIDNQFLFLNASNGEEDEEENLNVSSFLKVWHSESLELLKELEPPLSEVENAVESGGTHYVKPTPLASVPNGFAVTKTHVVAAGAVVSGGSTASPLMSWQRGLHIENGANGGATDHTGVDSTFTTTSHGAAQLTPVRYLAKQNITIPASKQGPSSSGATTNAKNTGNLTLNRNNKLLIFNYGQDPKQKFLLSAGEQVAPDINPKDRNVFLWSYLEENHPRLEGTFRAGGLQQQLVNLALGGKDSNTSHSQHLHGAPRTVIFCDIVSGSFCREWKKQRGPHHVLTQNSTKNQTAAKMSKNAAEHQIQYGIRCVTNRGEISVFFGPDFLRKDQEHHAVDFDFAENASHCLVHSVSAVGAAGNNLAMLVSEDGSDFKMLIVDGFLGTVLATRDVESSCCLLTSAASELIVAPEQGSKAGASTSSSSSSLQVYGYSGTIANTSSSSSPSLSENGTIAIPDGAKQIQQIVKIDDKESKTFEFLEVEELPLGANPHDKNAEKLKVNSLESVYRLGYSGKRQPASTIVCAAEKKIFIYRKLPSLSGNKEKATALYSSGSMDNLEAPPPPPDFSSDTPLLKGPPAFPSVPKSPMSAATPDVNGGGPDAVKVNPNPYDLLATMSMSGVDETDSITAVAVGNLDSRGGVWNVFAGLSSGKIAIFELKSENDRRTGRTSLLYGDGGKQGIALTLTAKLQKIVPSAASANKTSGAGNGNEITTLEFDETTRLLCVSTKSFAGIRLLDTSAGVYVNSLDGFSNRTANVLKSKTSVRLFHAGRGGSEEEDENLIFVRNKQNGALMGKFDSSSGHEKSAKIYFLQAFYLERKVNGRTGQELQHPWFSENLVRNARDAFKKFNESAKDERPVEGEVSSGEEMDSTLETQELILSAGTDGNVIVWRGETGEILRKYSGHANVIGAVPIDFGTGKGFQSADAKSFWVLSLASEEFENKGNMMTGDVSGPEGTANAASTTSLPPSSKYLQIRDANYAKHPNLNAKVEASSIKDLLTSRSYPLGEKITRARTILVGGGGQPQHQQKYKLQLLFEDRNKLAFAADISQLLPSSMCLPLWYTEWQARRASLAGGSGGAAGAANASKSGQQQQLQHHQHAAGANYLSSPVVKFGPGAVAPSATANLSVAKLRKELIPHHIDFAKNLCGDFALLYSALDFDRLHAERFAIENFSGKTTNKKQSLSLSPLMPFEISIDREGDAGVYTTSQTGKTNYLAESDAYTTLLSLVLSQDKLHSRERAASNVLKHVVEAVKERGTAPAANSTNPKIYGTFQDDKFVHILSACVKKYPDAVSQFLKQIPMLETNQKIALQDCVSPYFPFRQPPMGKEDPIGAFEVAGSDSCFGFRVWQNFIDQKIRITNLMDSEKLIFGGTGGVLIGYLKWFFQGPREAAYGAVSDHGGSKVNRAGGRDSSAIKEQQQVVDGVVDKNNTGGGSLAMYQQLLEQSAQDSTVPKADREVGPLHPTGESEYYLAQAFVMPYPGFAQVFSNDENFFENLLDLEAKLGTTTGDGTNNQKSSKYSKPSTTPKNLFLQPFEFLLTFLSILFDRRAGFSVFGKLAALFSSPPTAEKLKEKKKYSFLQAITESKRPSNVFFDNLFVKSIIRFKWHAFAMERFHKEFRSILLCLFLHFLFVVSMHRGIAVNKERDLLLAQGYTSKNAGPTEPNLTSGLDLISIAEQNSSTTDWISSDSSDYSVPVELFSGYGFDLGNPAWYFLILLLITQFYCFVQHLCSFGDVLIIHTIFHLFALSYQHPEKLLGTNFSDSTTSYDLQSYLVLFASLYSLKQVITVLYYLQTHSYFGKWVRILLEMGKEVVPLMSLVIFIGLGTLFSIFTLVFAPYWDTDRSFWQFFIDFADLIYYVLLSMSMGGKPVVSYQPEMQSFQDLYLPYIRVIPAKFLAHTLGVVNFVSMLMIGAHMTATVNKVKAEQAHLFDKMRAEIILIYENDIEDMKDERFFPKYLHVLKPKK